MKNESLAKDYLTRCKHRLVAIATLHKQESWADVVRESQEVVELALKGLLRHSGIEVPRIHDVSEIMLENAAQIDMKVRDELEKIAEISRTLRRDRELAFYGSDDLTPSEFKKQLEKSGFNYIEVETGEFMKSGGSVFCLKMWLGVF